MCGRFALTATPEEVRRLFAFLDLPNFPPRDEIRPTEPIGIVAVQQGERRFVLVRWGFVPGWVKDPREFSLLINARAETAAEKPSFRCAMRHGRCLVPEIGRAHV
jgi:putative SOS response-associated peptidase YedK